MKYEIYALGRAGRALQYSLSSLKPIEDILFLSVPDNVISEVAFKISKRFKLPKIVAHLSGVYSYEILEPLRGKTAIAQFHPLASLAGDRAIPAGSLCAISSDQALASKVLMELAQQINMCPVALKPHKSVQYHAAAVLTGNLSLALVSKSIELMQEAGIDSASARIGLSKLLHSIADNIAEREIPEALTGPIARKDSETIKKHLQVLTPEVKQIYQKLSEWLS